jgi:hypothetical protein
MIFSSISIALEYTDYVQDEGYISTGIEYDEASYSSNNSSNISTSPPNPTSINFGNNFTGSEARIAVNDTTGEYHVLTMSDHSGAQNGNNNNAKMVAQSFSSNGTPIGSESTYDFGTGTTTIQKKDTAILPNGEIIVHERWYDSNQCGEGNSQGGYRGQYHFFNDTNLSESHRTYSSFACADGPIGGFITVGDYLIHSVLYRWCWEQDQSWRCQSQADFHIISKPEQNNGAAIEDTMSITCPSSGCGPTITFVGAYGNDSVVIDYRRGGSDNTNRRMVWTPHNDSSYEIYRHDVNDIAIGIDSQRGIIVENNSGVYYQNISTGIQNSSGINQSILSSLPHKRNSAQNYLTDPIYVTQRGDLLDDNWYIQPDTGKIIEYNSQPYGFQGVNYNPVKAFTENSGGMSGTTLYFYDWDRDNVYSSHDSCKSSPINYSGPDLDGDGCYDFEDWDDDGDGYSDVDELTNCSSGDPYNNSITPDDNDNDFICDNLDDDDDNDGYSDVHEQLCNTDQMIPFDVPDNDGDGICDLVDPDDDNDNVNDTNDLAPFDIEASGPDTDGDGLIDNITSAYPYYLVNDQTQVNMTQYRNASYWQPAEYTATPSWSWNDMQGLFSITKDDVSLLVNTPNRTGDLEIQFQGSGDYSISLDINYTSMMYCSFEIGILSDVDESNENVWRNLYNTKQNQMNEDLLSPAGGLLGGKSNITGALLQGNHTLTLTISLAANITQEAIDQGHHGCDERAIRIISMTLPHGGITEQGLYADSDDDGDGFFDIIESEGWCSVQSDPTSNISTPPDLDGDRKCDDWDENRDGDSYNNSDDAFPDDINEWYDTDGDLIGNNADTDDDADGYNDTVDPWPLDECVGLDHDSDGLADTIVMNCITTVGEDSDDDNDGKLDQDDFCSLGELNWLSGAVTDHDQDGCRDDGEDLDDDNDNINDLSDLCPRGYTGWISNPNADADGDGCHDLIEDNDDDNDGVGEPGDNCPNTPANVTVDGFGCPVDTDGDGVADYLDNCENTPSWVTVDSNGCPVDTDGDGTPDYQDDFPNDANETTDSDGDGTGDNADAFPNDANETADSDRDGVGDNSDAFPNDANETADSDGDGTGDNADAFPNDANETADSDRDGVGDNSDSFPNDANETADSDGDGIGDNSDECQSSDPMDEVESDGCVLQAATSETSSLVSPTSIGISIGVILFIVLAVVLLQRTGDSIEDQILFEEESMPVNTPLEINPAPQIAPQVSSPPESEIGVLGDDGYYWLEWPSTSGSWYYRAPSETTWNYFEK